MCLPSAYCATSSGIAMTRLRDNTQPHCLSFVRTNVQFSRTAGFFSSPAFFSAAALSLLVLRSAVLSPPLIRSAESSCQLSGALGGLGGGGFRALREPFSFFCLRERGCGCSLMRDGGRKGPVSFTVKRCARTST